MTREAPWSYRPGKARAARLALYQHKHGLTQSEAIHKLLDAALDADEQPKVPKERSKWTV